MRSRGQQLQVEYPKTMFLAKLKVLVGDKRILVILKEGFDMIACLKSLNPPQ